MEQIQQFLEILKETPQMAIWGLAIWCAFVLLKLSSWIYALKVVAQQFIKRLFNYKDSKQSTQVLLKEKELEIIKTTKWVSAIDRRLIINTNDTFYELVKELVNLDTRISTTYVHEGDMTRAIQIIKDYKNEQSK